VRGSIGGSRRKKIGRATGAGQPLGHQEYSLFGRASYKRGKTYEPGHGVLFIRNNGVKSDDVQSTAPCGLGDLSGLEILKVLDVSGANCEKMK
jgi:hypothetical protein